MKRILNLCSVLFLIWTISILILIFTGKVTFGQGLGDLFYLIDQNLLKQYLKVLALYFRILTPVFNSFYELFCFKNEECFFPKRISIVV